MKKVFQISIETGNRSASKQLTEVEKIPPIESFVTCKNPYIDDKKGWEECYRVLEGKKNYYINGGADECTAMKHAIHDAIAEGSCKVAHLKDPQDAQRLNDQCDPYKAYMATKCPGY
jgi:hypothetical protein